jgi:hypothetical protein
MATKDNTQSVTLIAGADLSALQYTFVTLNSAGQVVAPGAGAGVVGVLQNDPASGQAALVDIAGITKVVAGAAITTGARVMTTSAGKAITGTATNNLLGIALETGADTRVIRVLLQPTGILAA